MTMDEQDLVLLLKARNEPAFSQLYDLYSGALYGIILKTVTNQVMACEVLEKTFTQAWCTIESYDASRMKLFTWLQHIARSLAGGIPC